MEQVSGVLQELMARAEEVRAVELDSEIARQLEERRCSLAPPPQVPTRPFRSERTVEQNRLFVSNNFEGESVTHEEIVKQDSGEPVRQRIIVGKVADRGRARGVLKQIHQEVFYRLLELWGERGYPLAVVEGKPYGLLTMTTYALARAIRGDDSDSHYRRVKDLIQDLATTPIVLENVYTWRGMRDREVFTLLGDVQWSERDLDEETGSAESRDKKAPRASTVSVLFSAFVTEGFMRKNVKMLLAQPYFELGAEEEGKKRNGRRSEVARLLYPFLDAQLAGKDEYHSRLDALAARFHLTNHPYKSLQRRQFEPAVRALDGKPILGHRFHLRVNLREGKGGELILVAKRETAKQLALALPAL